MTSVVTNTCTCPFQLLALPFQRNVQRSAADLDQASLGSQACEDREKGGGGAERERERERERGGGGLKARPTLPCKF